MTRVLMAHNYYSRKNPSGEHVSFESEVALLREHGHEVDVFTRESEEIERYGVREKIRLVGETIWSRATVRSLRAMIRTTKPTIAHFQNTFPLLSPSAYYACREAGLPVVQTLRNYRLLCPSANFFRDGHVCEDCLGKKLPLPGVVHACYRESRPLTAVVASMLTFHNIRHTWDQMVDVYITPTQFVREKFIQGGIPATRLLVKPNFVSPDPGPGAHGGNFALFVGRLDSEKGVRTLLKAWRKLGNHIPLKIVGDGPLADEMAQTIANMPAVEWLGRQDVRTVYDLMGDAAIVVFPTEWYEAHPRVTVEAFAKGTPVIAARIGAAAEVVEHRRTGLLFNPGDADDLAANIEWAWGHRDEVVVMGSEARHEYQEKYTAERNYQRLMEIYSYAQTRPGR